eukprot:Amastigsp_a676803_55.p4 type:complete len:109 gc:universal Amastigsp_a676803_55:392-718(+)
MTLSPNTQLLCVRSRPDSRPRLLRPGFESAGSLFASPRARPKTPCFRARAFTSCSTPSFARDRTTRLKTSSALRARSPRRSACTPEPRRCGCCSTRSGSTKTSRWPSS